MLQQTQASRVEEKYPLFLKRFPTLASLSRAAKHSVVRAWRGMGYNNRAVRLQQLAKDVMRNHNGKLPRAVDELDLLPGIGKYTSHAIACFAFGQPVPAVDTNVRRVLSRLFPLASKRRDIWDIAQEAVPPRRAYDWNQALFDFGATICTQRNPKCDICPVKRYCPSAFRINGKIAKPAKREPARDGIPNRIYRGRIVEVLRNLKGNRALSLSTLGKRIKSNYRLRDSAWLRKLLQQLERDRLVSLTNGSSAFLVRLAK